MRPRALGPVATETLVRQRLPAASSGFTHACHAVTGGNPFLLGALLTELIADAVAPDDPARTTPTRCWARTQSSSSSAAVNSMQRATFAPS